MRTRRIPLRLLLLTSAALGHVDLAFAQALPSGGTVRAGSASIGAPVNGGLTVNQSSQRAVVNWQNFNVGAGNSVTFQQPNASAATLNRVTGAQGSSIAGSINANGRVYLVNPNGIQITPSGNVDAKGGFVASTLGVTTQDFMRGKDKFTGKGASAAVINQGNITTAPGGDVALIGGSVSNEGTIAAPLGKVALGAGEAATLDLNGDGFLQVTVPSNTTDASGKPLVSNSGRIEAAGGTVELKAAVAREALRDAVNMSGAIVAHSVSSHDGLVVLGGDAGTTNVSGTVDVSGPSQGGQIDVSGASVNLTGATLDARGGNAGGLVRVGGPFQGGKADPASPAAQKFMGRFPNAQPIATAQTTTVDAASKIDVSATGAAGLGGTAIVWSDQKTIELARIDAHGQGAGGTVEVSSKGGVQSVSLLEIIAGKGGELLLDPKNINIIDDDGVTSFNTVGDTAFADNPDDTLTLKAQDILGYLSTGTDLTLQASNDITWSGTGGGTSVNPGHLTLDAGRSVIFNLSNDLTLWGGDLTIIANDTHAAGVVDVERDPGEADVNFYRAFDPANPRILDALADQPGVRDSTLTVRLLDGAGNTNTTAGSIAASPVNFTNVIFDAKAGKIQLYDSFTANTITLTGNIELPQGNSSQSIEAFDTVTWTNAFTSTITAPNGPVSIALTSPNGASYQGRITADADAIRLLPQAAGDGTYTTVYGDTNDPLPTITAVIDPRSALQSFAAGDSASVFRGTAFGIIWSQVNGHNDVGTYSGFYSSGGSVIRGSAHGSYLVDTGSLLNSAPVLTWTVTPRPVMVTAMDAGGFVYGQPDGATATTFEDVSPGRGWFNGDDLRPIITFSGVSGSFVMDYSVDGEFSLPLRTPAGTHTYTVTGFTGNQAVDYVLDTNGSVLSAQSSVTAAPLTVGVSPGQYTYGTPQALVTLTGVLGGDQVLPTANVAGVGGIQTMTDAGGGSYAFDAHLAAGTRVYTVNGLAGTAAGNYTIDFSGVTPQALQIDPLEITYGITGPTTSTYGTLASETVTLNGALIGDDVAGVIRATNTGTSAAGTLALNTPAGSYALDVSGLSGGAAGNYTLATSGNSGNTLTVSPKELTYTSLGSDSVYGTLASISISLNGVVLGDDVAATPGLSRDGSTFVPWTATTPAAPGYFVEAAALTGTTANNYFVDNLFGNNTLAIIAIAKKTVTYSIADANGTYGTLATAGALTLNGIELGDSLSAGVVVKSGGSVVTLAARTLVGDYAETIGTLGGASLSNYTLGSGTDGTLHIAPLAIGYSIGGLGGSQTYGTVGTPTVSLPGVLGGDMVTPLLSTTTQSGVGITVSARLVPGDYIATVTGISGAQAGQYVLSSGTPLSFTVHPALLTYTIPNLTVTYGTGAFPTVTLSGIFLGDVVTANGQILADGGVSLPAILQAGPHDLSVGGILGPDAFKYIVDTSGAGHGTLTVSAKALTYAVTSVQSTYGTLAILGGASLSGIVGSDQVAATVVATGPGGAALTTTTPVGQYAETVSGLTGANSSNYSIATSGNSDGVVAVNAKPLNYTVADAASTYGTLASLGAASLSGIVGSDQVVISGVAAFSGSTPVTLASTTAVGSYAERVTGIGGTGSSNYVLATGGNVDGTLTIGRKSLTYATGNAASVYGTLASLGAATLSGVIGVDSVSANVSLDIGAPDIRTGVGTHNIVVSGLSGAQAGNYTVTNVGSAIGALTVTPKTVTYSLSLAQFFSGFASPLGTNSVTTTYGLDDSSRNYVAQGTVNGLVPGDAVGVAISQASIPLSGALRLAAGTYSYTGTGINGPDSGNYVLAIAGNTNAVVTINPTPASYNPQSATSTYGNAANIPNFSFTGILFGDHADIQALIQTSLGAVVPSVTTPAGTYAYASPAVGSGPDGADYIPQISARGFLTVSPRPLTGQTPGLTTTYGTLGVLGAASLSGIVNGDSVSPVTSLTNSGHQVVTMAQYMDAGAYSYFVSGLAGPDVSNYTLVNAGADGIHAATSNGVLSVQPKTLGYTVTPPSGGVYGTTVGSSVQLTGILNNDQVALVQELQTVTSVTDPSGHGVQTPHGQLLDVGTYSLFLQAASGSAYSLTGAAAHNYLLPNDQVASLATIIITPKSVVYTVSDAATVYGTYAGYTTSLSGVLPGQGVSLIVTTVDSNGHAVMDNAQTDAGSFMRVGTLGNPAAVNYVIDPSSHAGALTIAPKALTLTVASGTAVYGDAVLLATLPGVLFSDEVNPVISGPLVALDGSRDYGIAGRTNVGTYNYAITSISGAKAADYSIFPATGTLTITPKVLSYSVPDSTAQYGGFSDSGLAANASCFQSCSIWPAGFTLPGGQLTGVVPGDTVTTTTQVLDLTGNPVTYSTTTPVGHYFEVVTGIGGASVGNYTLATGGNRPGVFTINPDWVAYATSSAVFLPGTGLVGTPGIVTRIDGGNGGGLPNGETLAPIVVIFDSAGNTVASYNNLGPGTYYFKVVGFQGATASDYRIFEGSSFVFQAHTLNTVKINSPYSDIGTLSVLPSLSLDFIQPTNNIPAPHVNPPTPALDSTALVVTTGTPNGTSTTDTTTATSSNTTSSTGASSDNTASQQGSFTVNYGGTTITGDESTTAEALAKVGVTGVDITNTAGGAVSVTMTTGPATITAAANANASSDINLSLLSSPSLTIANTAGATASQTVSFQGSAGAAGTGTASTTTTVFANANSTTTIGYEDGKFTVKEVEMAGGGASAGATGGLSGSVGSASGSATVYSPGSFGVGGSGNAGYSNGEVQLGFSLTLDIGLGGLTLGVNFGISVSALESAANAVKNFFTGPSADPNWLNDGAYDIDRYNNPAALYQYMNSYYGDGPNTYGAARFDSFLTNWYNTYPKMGGMISSVINQENNLQSELATNPQAFIAAFHANPNLLNDLHAQEQNVINTAGSIGYAVHVQNGVVTMVQP